MVAVNKDKDNFEACFKSLQEVGKVNTDKVCTTNLPTILTRQDSETGFDVYGIEIEDNSDFTDGKIVYFKTKIGIISVLSYVCATDPNSAGWYLDETMLSTRSTQSEFMNFLETTSIDPDKYLEFLIGNHLPEPGSIEPIKNIVHHVDEWLNNQKDPK